MYSLASSTCQEREREEEKEEKEDCKKIWGQKRCCKKQRYVTATTLGSVLCTLLCLFRTSFSFILSLHTSKYRQTMNPSSNTHMYTIHTYCIRTYCHGKVFHNAVLPDEILESVDKQRPKSPSLEREKARG